MSDIELSAASIITRDMRQFIARLTLSYDIVRLIFKTILSHYKESLMTNTYLIAIKRSRYLIIFRIITTQATENAQH